MTDEERPQKEEEPLHPSEGEGERRDSITDVHGTIARFEMAYEPPKSERQGFGAPFKARLPSYLYAIFAIAASALAAIGYGSPPGSRLHTWIVVGDRQRPMSAGGLALIVFLSAVATVVRSHMRGVVVHPDGVEARYLLPLGVPRVRKWAWAQIHRIILSPDAIAVELWDGTYDRLPPVGRQDELRRLLAAIGHARKISVTELA